MTRPKTPVYFNIYPTRGLPPDHPARVAYERRGKTALLQDDGTITWPQGEVKAVSRRVKHYPITGVETLVFLTIWNGAGKVLQPEVIWETLSSEATFEFLVRVAKAQQTGGELFPMDEETVLLILRARLMLIGYIAEDLLVAWDARAKAFADAVCVVEDIDLTMLSMDHAAATTGVRPVCWWDRDHWPSVEAVQSALSAPRVD